METTLIATAVLAAGLTVGAADTAAAGRAIRA